MTTESAPQHTRPSTPPPTHELLQLNKMYSERLQRIAQEGGPISRTRRTTKIGLCIGSSKEIWLGEEVAVIENARAGNLLTAVDTALTDIVVDIITTAVNSRPENRNWSIPVIVVEYYHNNTAQERNRAEEAARAVWNGAEGQVGLKSYIRELVRGKEDLVREALQKCERGIPRWLEGAFSRKEVTEEGKETTIVGSLESHIELCLCIAYTETHLFEPIRF